MLAAVPWWVASIISNLAIITTEYLNRTATGGFLSVLPKTFWLIVIAQVCLFRSFNGAPHWMIAWVVFALGNSLMRVTTVRTFSGHEIGNWWYASSGVAVMLLGALLVKQGMK